MRRRDLIAALGLAAVPAAALASAPPSASSQPAQNYVDITPAALPVLANGRLVNYVFVTVRINLRPGADVVTLRAKEPYFRDALVRLAHRTPFGRPDDYTRIDQARLRAALLPHAAAIAGRGVVTSVAVLTETPRRRSGLPRPPGAGGRPSGPAIVP